MEKVFCKGKKRGMSLKVLVLLLTATIMFAVVPTMNIVRAPNIQVILDENFESTEPGDLPPGWVDTSQGDGLSRSYVYQMSGNKVLLVDDYPTDSNKAMVTYYLNSPITNGVLEFKFMFTFYYSRIIIGFPDINTLNWYLFTWPTFTTELRYWDSGSEIYITDLSPNTWYDFKIVFDLVNGLDLYVNSALVLSGYPIQYPDPVSEFTFSTIWFPASDVYVDDVVLTTTLPEPTILFSDVMLILPMAVLAGTLVILRKRKRNTMEN